LDIAEIKVAEPPIHQAPGARPPGSTTPRADFGTAMEISEDPLTWYNKVKALIPITMRHWANDLELNLGIIAREVE